MATFTNQATLTYRNRVTVSNIVTGELQQTVSLYKSTPNETYRTGDVLTYVVSLINGGSTALTGLTVTDNLGAYTVCGTTVVPTTYVPGSVRCYTNGILQGAPTLSDTDPLTVTGITLPAGGNGFLIYQVSVNDFAPPAAGSTVTNAATVSGAGLSEPVSDTVTVTAESESLLTVSKMLSPTTVSEGDRLTYTFIIQNYGNIPVVATDDATVTDTFDPILTDPAVTFNGQAWVAGVDYTYNEATGAFGTVPTRILIPAATYTQDAATHAWTVVPGVGTLVVAGTVRRDAGRVPNDG